jgi:predicted alpha/beta hydrolase
MSTPPPEPYVQEFIDRPAGYRIGMQVYPDPGPSAPVVLIWPALGAPARFYRPVALALGAAGIAAVAVDLRGTGSSTPAPSRADRYGYPDLAADVGAVVDALKPRLDGRRHYLMGHSLGAQLCTLHLALSDREDGPAGLILTAVGLPYFRHYTSWSWPRRLGVLGVTQGIAAVAAVNRVWPGWGFGGRAARRLMLDWGYTARHGHFPPVDGQMVDLGRVRTPVLAISVPRDRLTPRETLDHLCAQLTGAPVDRVHLDGDLDHFSWVRVPEAVASHVVRFVNGAATAG